MRYRLKDQRGKIGATPWDLWQDGSEAELQDLADQLNKWATKLILPEGVGPYSRVRGNR